MEQQLGRYRLIRHVATGGMGEVYTAEAPGAAGFAKRLVIKTLRTDLAEDQRLVDQFVAEGRLLEALDHPNIAQILDLGCVDGTYFLAMEHVAGFDLRDLRRALPGPEGKARLQEDAVLCVIAAVADALHHAATRRGPDGRRLRIVHHDVTPSNVMVRRDGHVKLVDFGIARSAIRARLKQESLRGKLPYMAPEQAAMGRVDGRADLFSLGITAFELLLGERPYEVAEIGALAAAQATLPERFATLRSMGISTGTATLVEGMLALDRHDRPADAASVATQARAQLVEHGQLSVELPLAAALQPAFKVLEAQASGFDATLSSLLGPAPGAGPMAGEPTGTVSLPGLELAQPVPIAAPTLINTRTETADPGGPPVVPLRKRVIFAALLVLVGTASLGWWLGSRGDRGEERPSAPVPAVAVSVESPDASGQAPDAQAADSAADATMRASSREASDAGKQSTDGAGEAGRDAGSGDVEPAVADTVAGPGRDVESADAGRSEAAPPRPRPASTTKRPRAPRGQATLSFLVLPADCEVRIDGKPAEGTGGRYQLRLSAGPHVVEVRDPVSGNTVVKKVTLSAGQRRSLPGFKLAGGVP